MTTQEETREMKKWTAWRVANLSSAPILKKSERREMERCYKKLQKDTQFTEVRNLKITVTHHSKDRWYRREKHKTPWMHIWDMEVR